MTRKSRTLALAKKWYVSFGPVGRKQKRATRMFETEDQAKAFALNFGDRACCQRRHRESSPAEANNFAG
jgi:hypothetical protein